MLPSSLAVALLPLMASIVVINICMAQQSFLQQYPYCDNPVFCSGDLLDTIQMARLYSDSKTFVDMKLKASPQQTVAKFDVFKNAHPQPTADDLRRFVDDNFDPEGSEFQTWKPTDWNAKPAILQKIRDEKYRTFASRLHDLWHQLGRNMSAAVAQQPELYSIIYVPNPVIVPGGRFREFYYWDSYWIQMGLLHSEMMETVRGMLLNFLSIVDRYGFVPNGGRIYYLGRSQPPLLIPMVKQYLDASGDVSLLRDAIATLEREFDYWWAADNATVVEVRGHRLARYADRSPGPRPEAYWEDRMHAANLNNDSTAAQAEFYAELKAGAASGMDYSSRWFIDANATNGGTLKAVQCRSIVPVELNAVLWWNANLLSEFHKRLGNAARATQFRQRADTIYAAIEAVLWHEDVGVWLDWDVLNGKRREYFTPTNLAPLWTGAFNRTDAKSLSGRVLEYVKALNLSQYPGGVPNSLEETGEQWDFPNVWAPMQHMLIVALGNLGTKQANDVALDWASKWVFTNYVTFNRTKAMFEKYSAVEIGNGGSGGEYKVQLGFGWSNGVVLDLLHKYGDRLKSAAVPLSASFGVFVTVAIAVCYALDGLH